ncbi:hypothetical protein ACIQJ4_31965 [Streptomyces filamentosus]|uniref:hypothetical protein n=1 Tax=Streptomyces filamentosus TaxID=67294 RepID=UPI003810C64B
MGSWRGKPWLLWAALTVPAAATLAGIGTYTRVLGPEDPPKPSRADLVGRYEDGQGGEVTLRADLTADVRGIEHNLYDDGGGAGKRCDTWSWTVQETRPRWYDAVLVAGPCGFFHSWDVDGSPSAPRLIHYVGNSPPLDRRVLTRR